MALPPLADILALFPDNTTGLISAADQRSMITDLYNQIALNDTDNNARVRVAGDTMTGALTVQDNIQITVANFLNFVSGQAVLASLNVDIASNLTIRAVNNLTLNQQRIFMENFNNAANLNKVLSVTTNGEIVAVNDFAQTILNALQVAATTLPPGSAATVSYDAMANLMTFGIPQGAAGPTGGVSTVQNVSPDGAGNVDLTGVFTTPASGYQSNNAPLVADLNSDDLVGGWYRAGGSTLNKPDAVRNYIVLHQAILSGGIRTQIAVLTEVNMGPETYTRRRAGGSWGAWLRLTDTSNGYQSELGTILPSNNANLPVDGGFYRTNTVTTNAPPNQGNGVILQLPLSGDTDGYQIAITNSDIMYFRRRVGVNAWSSWYRVTDDRGGYQNIIGGSVPNNNADNITTGGFYATIASTQNTPSATVGGTLLHMPRDNGVSAQMWIGTDIEDTYVRTENNQTWSSWVRLTDNRSGYQNTAAILPDNNDLNDTVLGGFYLGNAATANKPDDLIGTCIFMPRSGGNDGAQFFITGTGATYIRNKQGATTWGNWTQLANSSNLNRIVDANMPAQAITASVLIDANNVGTYANRLLYVPATVTTGTINVTIDWNLDLEGFWFYNFGTPTAFNIVGGIREGTSDQVSINGETSVTFPQYSGGRIERSPANTNLYGLLATFGPQSMASGMRRPISTSAALVQASYDDASTLGPNADIEYTGAGGGNVVFFPLIPSDSAQGTTWYVTNNSTGPEGFLRLQLEEISGTNKGEWFGEGDFSADGRDVDIQHGETVVVTAFTRVDGGINRFLFRSLGPIEEVVAGTGVTVTGTSRRPIINSMATGAGVTSVFLRDPSHTLPDSTADNTYALCETTGTTDVSITMPSSTVAGNINKRIKIVNHRPDVSARVNILFPSGTTIQNAFQNEVDLGNGESVTVYYIDSGRVILVDDGFISIAPAFPSNPNNDDNTFMFTVNGDTPATWTRDRNTRIDLNNGSGGIDSYEIANPATSGITVGDGDGYIFRNINTVSWNIFPFAAGNTMVVDGTTYTSGSPFVLQANRSLVLLYDTGQARWEGREFTFLLPVSGAGGATGQTGETPVVPFQPNLSFMNLDVAIQNVEGADVKHGDLLCIKGESGVYGAELADFTNQFGGVCIGDSANNGNIRGRIRGRVDDVPNILDTNDDYVITVLANDTPLYWDHGFGHDDRLNTDIFDGSEQRTLFGVVVGGRFTVPVNATARPLGTNVTYADSAAFDADKNKSVDFTGQGANTLELPNSQTGGWTIGDVIVLEVTPDAAQTGTVSVHSATGGTGGTLDLRDTDGTTYTSGSPLVMASTSGKQYRKFVATYEEGIGEYWLAFENLYDIVNHDYVFSTEELHYNDFERRIAETDADVASVTQRVTTVETWPLIAVSDADYAGGGANANKNVLISMQGLTATRTFTMGAHADYGLTGQEMIRFRIENQSNQHFVKVVNPAGNGNFFGMDEDYFYIEPLKTQEMVIERDGGNYRVYPFGRVAYDFEYDITLWNGSAGTYSWAQAGVPLPADIIAIDGTNTDRLNLAGNCILTNVRLDGLLQFDGTEAMDFDDISTSNPNIEMRKSASSVELFHEVTIQNFMNYSAPIHNEIGVFLVTAGEYLHLQGANFTDILAVNLTLRGTIVQKFG